MAAMGTPAAVSDAMKNRRRTTTKAKRPSAPKVSVRRNPSSANANTKYALLKRERDEALEQEKATAEVLQIISNRPGDLDSVFQSVLANAVRLCDATFGVMYRYDDQAEAYTAIALFEAPAALEEHYHKRGAFSPVPGSSLDHVARTGGVVNKADASAEPAPGAPRDIRRGPVAYLRANGERFPTDRGHYHLPPGGPSLYCEAGFAGEKLRRPSRDRHREYAAAQ